MILVMTTLGRWLEANGKRKANAALDALTKLLPDRVRRIRDGQEEMVPSDEIQIDDRVRVLPGERFPVDGRVVRNRGLVEEQVLTGESKPVLKERGDRILGGTLNLDGDLTIQVAEVGDQGTLARVVQLVKRGAGIERAVSKAGRPGLAPICSGRLGDCVVCVRRSLGVRFSGARTVDGPGGDAHRLSVAVWGWPRHWRCGVRSVTRRASGSCSGAARPSNAWPKSPRFGSTRRER